MGNTRRFKVGLNKDIYIERERKGILPLFYFQKCLQNYWQHFNF